MNAQDLFEIVLSACKVRSKKDRGHGAMTTREHYWKQRVVKRDRQCKVIGCGNTDLIAHHIKGFTEHPEEKYNLNNGATLCHKHHVEFHRKYGTKDFNDVNLTEFIYEQNNTGCNKRGLTGGTGDKS